MKKNKNIITLLAAAILLILLPYCNSLKASAAEPVTYAVKYMPDDNDWRYQADTSTFDETAPDRELYYLYESLKDGDAVVVYNDYTESKELNLGNVRLSNLTVVRSNSFSIIYTGGIDECFVLAGSSCSVNGDITNAHVYDSVVCNFGGNVKELNIYAEDEVLSTIGCSGTVGHLYAPSSTLARTFYNLYDFKANSLNIQEGRLQTPEWQYSQTPSQNQTTAPPTPAPQQSAASQPGTSTSSSDDEYDDVPKTGETDTAAKWLLCISALCLAGSFALKLTGKINRRKEQNM